MTSTKKFGLMAALVLALLGWAPTAHTKLLEVKVLSVEDPAFQGKSFGSVGTYVRLSGKLRGEIDPTLKSNQVIVDLPLAEKDAQKKIIYEADFYILRPKNLQKGNGTILYDFGNRGIKTLLPAFSLTPVRDSNNLPGSDPNDVGDGYLFEEGYSIVWSGNQGDVDKTDARNLLSISLPIAYQKNGVAITGTTWEECTQIHVQGFGSGSGPFEKKPECTLNYEIADVSSVKVFLRHRHQDPPQLVPQELWHIQDNKVLFKKDKIDMSPSVIYQVVYLAKNPKVLGIGMAAIRDYLEFLRFEKQDTTNRRNEFFGSIKQVISYGGSQSARLEKDFVFLGFNQTEKPRQGRYQNAIDGMLVDRATGRSFTNFRFGRPGMAVEQAHGFQYFPNSQMPITFEQNTDPFTGEISGALDMCSKSKTCPKIINTLSSTEYWAFKGSLLTTSGDGQKDSHPPSNVRIYSLASTGHSAAKNTACVYPVNKLGGQTAFMRAQLKNLRNWIVNGTPPPASVIPTIQAGTLIRPEDIQFSGMGELKLQGLNVFQRPDYDYGPRIRDGIVDHVFPTQRKSSYRFLVPKVDKNGNELGGVRLPLVQVPLATRVGWNRLQGLESEACFIFGAKSYFPINEVTRAPDDQRDSITSLYPSGKQEFMRKVVDHTRELTKQTFFLERDVNAVIEEASKDWDEAFALNTTKKNL